MFGLLKSGFFSLSAVTALSVALGACSLSNRGSTSSLKIDVPALGSKKIAARVSPSSGQKRSGRKTFSRAFLRASSIVPSDEPVTFDLPENVDEFSCLGINVMARDIAPASDVDQCSMSQDPSPYIGKYAEALIPITGGSIEIELAQGSGRFIQLFGVQTSTGECPSLADAFDHHDELGIQFGTPFELARTTVDVFSDSTVSLKAEWDASSPRVSFCVGGGSELSTPYSEVELDLGESFNVSAYGGFGPYEFEIIDAGAGGTIDSASGLYVAPTVASSGVDQIMITDVIGNHAYCPQISIALIESLWDVGFWDQALWAD